MPTTPRLVSLTDARRILEGRADEDTDDDLLLFLHATDEVVEEIVGPLGETVPFRYILAARIIFEHLWDHWQGAVPVPFQSGTGETALLSGFAIPNAARELLLVPTQSTVAGSTPTAAAPRFAFPEPPPCGWTWP